MGIEVASHKKYKPIEKRQLLWHEVKKNKTQYLMMLPFFLLFTIFTVIPVVAAIVLSFTYFNMLEIPQWRGWTNYIRLFLDDDVFLIAIRNTLVFAFITGPISYFACLIFAWLINELPPKARAVMTFIFYLPSLSGSIFFMFKFIFSGDAYGFINGLLMKLHFIEEPVQWLTDPNFNLKIIILVQVWLSLGAAFLSFIAGLQGIDKQYYEAGAIDGIRNRWQELWYITLPSMGPQLLFGAVMQIGASFGVGSICVALAGFPSTDYSARTITTHMMDYGTVKFEMGYASAISVVLFITMLLVNIIIQKIIRKFSDF